MSLKSPMKNDERTCRNEATGIKEPLHLSQRDEFEELLLTRLTSPLIIIIIITAPSHPVCIKDLNKTKKEDEVPLDTYIRQFS